MDEEVIILSSGDTGAASHESLEPKLEDGDEKDRHNNQPTPSFPTSPPFSSASVNKS